MAALGAAALAHSTSIAASRLALAALTTPGSAQLLSPLGGAGCMVVNEPEVKPESPKVERNVVHLRRSKYYWLRCSMCQVPAPVALSILAPK